ncbi:hypothetical protein H2199_005817 [Coniosporium tulheliwenetii]|uniref:Uncharacterized protein n=1 Tax=Coniosporium tulheliwenetii TaxID=3383036 RepID=A0ACC2YXW0_9PEZI|nr:hypothetical protein H2199_005817 [Cladosporium sp. JES 115]
MERDTKVRRILNGLSPAEFASLPLEARHEVYTRHLVKENGRVLIDEADDEDFLNPEIAQGVILRQEYFMGADAVGRRIVEEAREVYYTQNTFAVQSHWLYEFMVDTPPAASQIVVRVDLRHVEDTGQFASKAKKGKEKSAVVRDLEGLMKVENAEWIGIEIEGSDLRTQQKIKEMSKIVKRLIERFGERLTIGKVQRKPGDRHGTYGDLKPYWRKPTAQAKENLRRCKASFEEVMQIQIEEWTREVSKVVTEDDLYWESLL